MSTPDSIEVAVIGAGIHGAGVAQAAAAAGYSVLLLEQSSIAAGSSSRSSKLIHGGLRYLETGQLRLVRESLHERSTLLRLAPQLVHLRRFYLPVYAHTRRRAWQLLIGLSLYALLAGFTPAARFGRVPRRDWSSLDGLDTQGLQHVFWYQDAQTDDRALTQAVVASAQTLGAQLRCPARCTGIALQEHGALVSYVDEAGAHQCQAQVVVNAAGPWADALARTVTPRIAVPELERIQGAHIVLPGAVTQGIYYVESPRDGRAVFVMPWHDGVMVGTTETRFRGDPASTAPTAAELQYLLGVLKHYFPRFRHSGSADIIERFAGLRVLPGGSGHAFHRSRETLLVPDRPRQPRLLSIYGGKLTTWRAVAQRALAQLQASLPARASRADTRQLPLPPTKP